MLGSYIKAYLGEAHRTLKLDGELHIVEPISRFSDRNRFAEDLKGLGFDIVKLADWWKFTHIRALKTDRRPGKGIEMRF